VNVRVVPTSQAMEESVDLAHEIFNRVFRKVPEQVKEERRAKATGCSPHSIHDSGKRAFAMMAVRSAAGPNLWTC
jgi:hypothetical protein